MRNNDASTEGRAVAQIRTRAMLFLIVAVAAGGAALFFVQRYMKQVESAAASAIPETTPVIVAAEDIAIAVRLEEKHLVTLNWPSSHVPTGSFNDMKDVIGKTMRQDVVKGEAILEERLADEDQGQGLAALLADGMRAMAVEVDAVVGVAGFVQPGDYVDVITTMRPDEETKRQRGEDAANVAKMILQNVRVLAVGEHLTTSPGGKPVNVKVVTLGVTPPESEKLALASQYGQIQLALRSRVDQMTQTTPGVSPAQLLAKEGGSPPRPPVEEPRQTLREPKRRKRESAPQEAAVPVVEILRGSSIENRTLRVQAGR